MSEQEQELGRVRDRIGRYIHEFVATLEGPREFHMEQLVRFVQQRSPETAPDSPSRILRDMRRKRELDYKVISRRDSHYQLIDLT